MKGKSKGRNLHELPNDILQKQKNGLSFSLRVFELPFDRPTALSGVKGMKKPHLGEVECSVLGILFFIRC
jgi:hypothetical protein